MAAKYNEIYTSPSVFEPLAGFLSENPSQEVLHYPLPDSDAGEIRFRRFRGTQNVAGEAGASSGGSFAGRVFLDGVYENLKTLAQGGGRTIWYDPSGRFSPEVMPAIDGVMGSFEEISDLPGLLRKPTLSQCLSWWAEWDLPGNIRRHTEVVARASYVLGVMLKNRGIAVDPILAHRGGLLHDLDKIATLEGATPHGELGAEFIRDQGYPALADIIQGHILGAVLKPGPDNRSWETKLVFFCDKLVEDDRIVPFYTRLKALKTRYPGFREVMERAEPSVWALNNQLCSILSIPGHRKLISALLELNNINIDLDKS